MRLVQYINENTEMSFEEVMQEIKIHCIPYLKELKSVDKLLLSGRQGKPDIFQGRVRKDREPKDTPTVLHDYLDDYFQSQLRVRPRSNSLFCSSSLSTANEYGYPYMIFPIGRYVIVYNPDVSDLWSELDNGDVDWRIVVDEELPYYLIDSFENDWEDEYGEGESGQYVYKGFETRENEKDEALEMVMDEKFSHLEKGTDEYDDAAWDVESDLEWEPEVSRDDYVEEKIENAKEEPRDQLHGLLDGYAVTTDLDLAMASGVEVMLMCDKYYAIHYGKYKKRVQEYMKDNHNIRLKLD